MCFASSREGINFIEKTEAMQASRIFFLDLSLLQDVHAEGNLVFYDLSWTNLLK